MKLTKQQTEILQEGGFDRLFFRFMADPNVRNMKDAYEKVEEVYFSVYSQNKYSCYNSYRNCRTRKLKKK